MERIKQIWTQLEGNSAVVPGLFKLRYSDISKCDVFLGEKFPETYRILILKVPFLIGKDFNFSYEVRGLKFEKIYDPDDSKYILLNLVLVDKQYQDVFDTLVVDVINTIIQESNIKIILKNYSNRLTKWQSLFETFNRNGMSPEEQRGLFGELYFLRKFLQTGYDFLSVVSSWAGTENQVRDFQSSSWAVEVKTTHGNNHQKVHISSERQLDTTNLENLFLYHISLEQRQKSGETLNEIIGSVSEILKPDLIAQNRFKSKIYESGYFDFQKNLYETIGYHIRRDVFYKVENDFPRIEENDIRTGVGDVKYSIILSQCIPFVTEESAVLDLVKP